MTTRETDPYKQMLTDQAKALVAREADITAREAQLKADREAIAQDRAKLDIARQHYEAFLASRRTPENPFHVPTDEFDDDYGGEPMEIGGRQQTAGPIPLPLRFGPKRRRVLEEVATATNGLTTREISDRTNVQVDVVRNIVASEIEKTIFARHGDRIVMTPAGLDYLNRATAKFGPAQKETPPATASGVFQ